MSDPISSPLVPSPRALARPRSVNAGGGAESGKWAWWKLWVSQGVWRWFWIAFAVRFVAAILIHLYSLSAGYSGFYPLPSGADDGTYWWISNVMYGGQPAPYTESYYPNVLALYFHLVGGPDLLMGKLLNVFAGALSVGIGVRIVEELGRGRASKKIQKRAGGWAGALLCFYPSLLWYSTQLVKDPILVLLGMAAVLFQIRFVKRASLFPIIGWALCLVGLFLFRPYAALATLLSLLAWVIRFNRRALLPALLLVGVLPFLVGKGFFGWNYIAPFLDTERMASFRQGSYSIGGSAVGIQINYSNPLLFLLTYSYSYATAMFGPFPWQLRGAAQLIALPEAIGLWLLFPIWWRGARQSLKRPKRERRSSSREVRLARRELLLMLLCLVLIGMIAIFSDNIGANTRLRLLPWSAFLLFAAPRLARKRWKLL